MVQHPASAREGLREVQAGHLPASAGYRHRAVHLASPRSQGRHGRTLLSPLRHAENEAVGLHGKRLYIGTELLLFQGFPIATRNLRELSDGTPLRLQADLAGNAIASTVVMAALSAVVFGSSWSTSAGANQVEETTATEAAEAMSLLKRAKRQRH